MFCCCCCVLCLTSQQQLRSHGDGPHLKVSIKRLVKQLGMGPMTPGLQGEQFIHYTTATPILCLETLT